MRPSAKQIACIRTILADGSEPKASEEFRTWFEISEKILAECPTSRHLAILANDANRSLAERSLAVWILGELNARSSARAVLKVLLGSEPDLSWHAAGTLSGLKVKGLVPPLVEAIRTSGHSHIKEGAIWVLTKIVDRRALSVLIEATSDQSYYIRRASDILVGVPFLLFPRRCRIRCQRFGRRRFLRSRAFRARRSQNCSFPL